MTFVYCFLTALLFLLSVIIVKTITFKSKTKAEAVTFKNIAFDSQRVVNKLSRAVQIPTVSHSNACDTDWNSFENYHLLIEELFPQVHKNLELTKINKYSLLYKWKGQEQRKPVLFTAHMDVVPVEEGTLADWEEAPFSGRIKDGYVWGRGSLDTKITMIGILEAVEVLLEQGFKPKSDIYLGFGHDEEVGGKAGAGKISEYLEQQGIEFDYVVDEGGIIVEGSVPGVDKPIALIGVGEKGYANIQISVKSEGGHSSMPSKHTSLGYIAQVISNLEKHQCPMRFSKPIAEFLNIIGPEMKGINKVVLANMWLFKPIFMKSYSNTKGGNALLRTTTAATMAAGSIEPNVLPQQSTATFNFRITPGDTGQGLISHIKRVNKNIPIDIKALRLEEPSLISSTASTGYKTLEGITRAVYPEALIAPYIVLAGTDAKKYENVSKNIYRFVPIKVDASDLARMHGINERVSFVNIEGCVRYFIQIFH